MADIHSYHYYMEKWLPIHWAGHSSGWPQETGPKRSVFRSDRETQITEREYTGKTECQTVLSNIYFLETHLTVKFKFLNQSKIKQMKCVYQLNPKKCILIHIQGYLCRSELHLLLGKRRLNRIVIELVHTEYIQYWGDLSLRIMILSVLSF